MYLLVICIPPLQKSPFKSYDHFLIRLFGCFLLSCRSFIYILDINPLSDMWCANVFSHPIGWLFTLLPVSLLCRSLFIWCSPTCLFLLFSCAFGVFIATRSLLRPRSRGFSPVLSSIRLQFQKVLCSSLESIFI